MFPRDEVHILHMHRHLACSNVLMIYENCVCRIQCNLCAKWRIISYDTMVAARDDDWTCKQLRWAAPQLNTCPE